MTSKTSFEVTNLFYAQDSYCRNRGTIPEDRINKSSSLVEHQQGPPHNHPGLKTSSHRSIDSSHSPNSFLSSASSSMSDVSMRSSHFSISSVRTNESVSFMVSESESDEDNRYEELSEHITQPTPEQQRILKVQREKSIIVSLILFYN